MSAFLVTYLDAIDERLLDYLDEDDELRPEVVKRLRNYASALLEGSITPAAVAEDWEDWFDLIGAYVAAYAPEDTTVGDDDAVTLMSNEAGVNLELSPAARTPIWRPSSCSSTPTPRYAWGSRSLGGERLVHRGGQVGVREVQIARRGGDVGMAEQALDDVDVRAVAQQGGRI